MTFWAGRRLSRALRARRRVLAAESPAPARPAVTSSTPIVGRGHGFETVKPLKLFEKIIQLWCPPDGTRPGPVRRSGTTGHAVSSSTTTSGTQRRFILIEQGRPEKGDSYARSLTADRLQRVVSGDWANGKGARSAAASSSATLDEESRRRRAAADGARGDGRHGHRVPLRLRRRRRVRALVRCSDPAYTYLVAKNADDEGFYLVWDGADQNTDFTEDVTKPASRRASKAGLKPRYHVYARLQPLPDDRCALLPDPRPHPRGLRPRRSHRAPTDATDEAVE